MQDLMHYSFLAESKTTPDQNHVSFLMEKQASRTNLQKRKSLIYECEYPSVSPTLLIQFKKRGNQATRSLQTNAITEWLNEC